MRGNNKYCKFDMTFKIKHVKDYEVVHWSNTGKGWRSKANYCKYLQENKKDQNDICLTCGALMLLWSLITYSIDFSPLKFEFNSFILHNQTWLLTTRNKMSFVHFNQHVCCERTTKSKHNQSWTLYVFLVKHTHTHTQKGTFKFHNAINHIHPHILTHTHGFWRHHQ